MKIKFAKYNSIQLNLVKMLMNFVMISVSDDQNKNIKIQTNSIELLTQEISSLTKQIETQREEIQFLRIGK